MSWSAEAWGTISPIYNQILGHPFITELISGKLDRKKFLFYIEQDVFYLEDYGKILSFIASKIENPQDREVFLEFSIETAKVEKEMHNTFFKKSDYLPISLNPSPSCLLYSGFLYKMLFQPSLTDVLGAILPCFVIYYKVGNYILAHQSKNSNPYQNWIDTYCSKEFEIAANTASLICDKIATNSTESQRKKMTEVYITASKMEWLFWDSAYKLEKWSL